MANPSWEPVIGRDFGDVAAQRFGWAGFNRQVEEGNAGRAFAAQEASNRWLAAASELAQRNAERQAAAAVRSHELAIARLDKNDADLESRHRFDVNTALALSDQAVRNKHWDSNILERNRQEQRGLDLAANYAKTKAGDVATAGQARDAAEEGFVQAQKNYAQTVAKLTSTLSPTRFVYNRAAGQFAVAHGVPGSLKPEEQQALNEANTQLAEAKGELAAATEQHGASLKSWAELQREANGMGLAITKKGSKYVLYSSAHDKTFEGPATTPAPVTERTSAPDPSVGSQWAGFSAALVPGMEAPPSYNSSFSGSALTPAYGGFNVGPAPAPTVNWTRTPDGRLVMAQ